MKFKDFTLRLSKTLLLTVMGVVLFVVGCLMVVYSSWFQNRLFPHLIEAINKSNPSMKITAGEIKLDFPLRIEVHNITVMQKADTMLSAASVKGRIDLLPLIVGDADIRHLMLERVKFNMGNPDSAMMMRIKANSLVINPAKVKLRTMDISLDNGKIDGGRVFMSLNPDTTAADTASTPPTDMSIKIKHLNLNDFTFSMRMLPTIDTLTATIPNGVLADGVIDLRNQNIHLRHFDTKNLGVKYIVPDSATIAATPVVPPSESKSEPWTVKVDSLTATGLGNALYTTNGYRPTEGFDPGYIEVSNLQLSVHNFYNRATDVVVPLQLSGTERCGLQLDAVGTLAVDSTALHLNDFLVNTPDSRIALTGMMGMGDLVNDPTVPFAINADASLGISDLKMALPAMSTYFNSLPKNGDIDALINVSGSMADMRIENVDLQLPSAVGIKMNGYLRNATDIKKLDGHISLNGKVSNPTLLNKLFFSNSPSLGIPALTLKGALDMHNGTGKADLVATTGGGHLALDGRCNINTRGYDLKLKADKLPLHPFLPDLEIGDVSAEITASGHGFDFASDKTSLKANFALQSLEFDGYNYSDIDIAATVANGFAHIDLNSGAPALKLNLTADGNLSGNCYDWAASLNGRTIDLKQLKFSEENAVLSTKATGNIEYCLDNGSINGTVALSYLNYTTDMGTIALNDVRAEIDSNKEQTDVTVHNRDLHAEFSSDCPIDSLIARITSSMGVVDKLTSSLKINVPDIQKALPPFRLDIHAGSNNMLSDILAESRMSFGNMNVSVANDSLISMKGIVTAFKTGETRIDTITVNASQIASRLNLAAHVGNRPGTLDEWAKIDLNAWLDNDKAGVLLTQHNIKGQVGFRIGGNIETADSTLTLRFSPLNPVIGYKNWTVNEDNFIYYNVPMRHLDANLHMNGEGSTLALYTEHEGGHDAEHDSEQEDLVLKLDDIHLADWITINPFAPPIKGDLSASMKVNYNGHDINGNGKVSLTDFYYGKERVGTFDSDLNIITNTSGTIRATADLSIDGKRTMTLAGNLNDSTAMSPFNLDFSMISFPMSVVNPFLPSGTVKLTGTLNGEMRISGDSEAPVFNGYLNFDSTAVKVAMTATSYAFSNRRIPVTNGLVTFDDFSISGVNENPLSVNGTVDISKLTMPRINLNMKARNMQLVNSSRATRGAEVYGKAFIDLDAAIKGNLSFLDIDAALTLLAGTNVTYVMADAQSVIESQSTSNMVRFVNFNDTTMVQAADSVNVETMLMNIDAMLTLQNGTTINVDLSPDGKNKVVVQAQGSLNYTQTPISSEGRLTGRLNINGGHVAYTPPLLSEKLFTFNEGSYVAFNGDLMNPLLNIHAVDVVKANVTQEGQNSRLVNFDVGLGVTGSLDAMNVAFDLSTDDDLTIANELQSMTPEQRANQAMNLLLYRTYTGPGTKGDANLSGNMLYSFLTSQLNTWAANTIKGVDLSFGIDQYNQTTNGTTQSTMSYSYQVSKSLFNDRFKIVVGGNYTTDADVDENFSQNLISNISFEYFLNKTQTMLVRLFRHTGFESILEGEVTQTGVGFVYKRKINKFSDILRPGAKHIDHIPNKSEIKVANPDTSEPSQESPAAKDSIPLATTSPELTEPANE